MTETIYPRRRPDWVARLPTRLGLKVHRLSGLSPYFEAQNIGSYGAPSGQREYWRSIGVSFTTFALKTEYPESGYADRPPGECEHPVARLYSVRRYAGATRPDGVVVAVNATTRGQLLLVFDGTLQDTTRDTTYTYALGVGTNIALGWSVDGQGLVLRSTAGDVMMSIGPTGIGGYAVLKAQTLYSVVESGAGIVDEDYETTQAAWCVIQAVDAGGAPIDLTGGSAANTFTPDDPIECFHASFYKDGASTVRQNVANSWNGIALWAAAGIPSIARFDSSMILVERWGATIVLDYLSDYYDWVAGLAGVTPEMVCIGGENEEDRRFGEREIEEYWRSGYGDFYVNQKWPLLKAAFHDQGFTIAAKLGSTGKMDNVGSCASPDLPSGVWDLVNTAHCYGGYDGGGFPANRKVPLDDAADVAARMRWWVANLRARRRAGWIMPEDFGVDPDQIDEFDVPYTLTDAERATWLLNVRRPLNEMGIHVCYDGCQTAKDGTDPDYLGRWNASERLWKPRLGLLSAFGALT